MLNPRPSLFEGLSITGDNMETVLVVFNTPESGLILDGIGEAIEYEIKEHNASGVRAELLWGPEECPGHGIWIWEGNPKFFPDEDGGQYEFIGGEWRLPNSAEWAHFRLTNTFELFAQEKDIISPEILDLTEENINESLYRNES